jgi:hypothetical protein
MRPTRNARKYSTICITASRLRGRWNSSIRPLTIVAPLARRTIPAAATRTSGSSITGLTIRTSESFSRIASASTAQ